MRTRLALLADRPLAPLRRLLGLGQDEDVLLLLLALLDRELGGVLLGAERQERAEPAHGQQANQNGDRSRAASLEITVTGIVAATGRDSTTTSRYAGHSVIRRPLRKIDPRQWCLRVTSRSDFGQIRIEHGSSR
jgi:hypothetical protein